MRALLLVAPFLSCRYSASRRVGARLKATPENGKDDGGKKGAERLDVPFTVER